jgi:hypothetical protein
MTRLHIFMRRLSNWLVPVLVTKWGVALVLIGTVALAGSASVYLTSTADHRAPAGNVPDAVTSVPAQSVCTPLVLGPLVVGGALVLPAQCNADVPHCTPALLVVAPDIACDDR